MVSIHGSSKAHCLASGSIADTADKNDIELWNTQLKSPNYSFLLFHTVPDTDIIFYSLCKLIHSDSSQCSVILLESSPMNDAQLTYY